MANEHNKVLGIISSQESVTWKQIRPSQPTL
jgi:hypothetical protein